MEGVTSEFMFVDCTGGNIITSCSNDLDFEKVSTSRSMDSFGLRDEAATESSRATSESGSDLDVWCD